MITHVVLLWIVFNQRHWKHQHRMWWLHCSLGTCGTWNGSSRAPRPPQWWMASRPLCSPNRFMGRQVKSPNYRCVLMINARSRWMGSSPSRIRILRGSNLPPHATGALWIPHQVSAYRPGGYWLTAPLSFSLELKVWNANVAALCACRCQR